MVKPFTFIALFSGIGGARQAVERCGGKCVASVERDKFSRQTYQKNFLKDNPDTYFKDIKTVDEEALPDFDFLTAGFPCQPFSIAGVSKKNSLGRAHGFQDAKQGNLFFDIIRILKAKRPAAFLLENVKNLTRHDGGRTFDRIKAELTSLDYIVSHRVVSAAGYVPQKRERTFILGFRQPDNFDLVRKNPQFTLNDIHIAPGEQGPVLSSILQSSVPAKYTLSSKLWQYLQDYKAKHARAGNGFGYSVVGPNDVARTLSARYGKDGSEILIAQEGQPPRRLTPRECARLMGFPDTFQIPVSDSQAYRQFGNSVVVPEFEAIVQAIVPHLLAVKNRT